MTWSSSSYGNPAGLGDALADYVDQNGGVVQAVFGNDPTAGLHLEGRWQAEGYQPLTDGALAPSPSAPLTLLAVVPGHVLLSGVTTFNGGASSVHSMAGLGAATTLVASWSDGQPFLAFGTRPAGGRLVALNMFPASSDAQAGLWDSTTNGAQLIANALVFAANAGGHAKQPPTYKVRLVAAPAPDPTARPAPDALDRPAETPAPAPNAKRPPKSTIAAAAPPKEDTKPREAAPRSTPNTELAPGEKPSTGNDVATVSTEGIEFPFPEYLENVVSQIRRRDSKKLPWHGISCRNATVSQTKVKRA